MRKAVLGIGMSCMLATVTAAAASTQDDPEMAAALAKCPSAAAFVRAQEQAKADAATATPAEATAAPSDPALRARLLEMERLDQQVRNGDWSQEAMGKMVAMDAEHLPQMRRIVAEHDGLPSMAQVGRDGVAAAWLLVQHADADPALQERVLGTLTRHGARSGEVSAHQLVLLTDRVLIANGKPQRYGSQLIPEQGRWVSKPIADPAQVDVLRAGMDEMPLADYVCVATQLFPVPSTPPGS